MRPTRTALLVLLLAALTGCESLGDPREPVVIDTFVRADLALIRSRPELVAGKYRRMAADLYDFHRGAFALFLRDVRDAGMGVAVSAFDGRVLTLGIGDVHPENFGTLLAADGSLALEPNDFDAADRYPYLWEVRRLCVGMVLAARLSNPDDPAARAATAAVAADVAHATAASYVQTIAALAAGGAPARITNARPDDVFVADLFDRARGDLVSRDELAQLTELGPEGRRLRRGVVDPEDPENLFVELPEFARAALPATVVAWRGTLVVPPAFDTTVIDAVRELGSGVASWPRVRIVILTPGPTEDPTDDVLLELKELADSPFGDRPPPAVSFDGVPERVYGSARRIWARPDAEPLWGGASFLGLPVQIRRLSEAQKTLRVRRLAAELGTPAAVTELGRTLGALLARIHAVDGAQTLAAIAMAVNDADAFAAEQAETAVAYADREEADWHIFQAALERLGPRLGVPPDERDQPSAEIAALYGP